VADCRGNVATLEVHRCNLLLKRNSLPRKPALARTAGSVPVTTRCRKDHRLRRRASWTDT